MNIVDRVVSWFNPAAGLSRLSARRALSYYEAAKPSRQRKHRRDTHTPNQLVQADATSLRAQARYLERNHDIARGILRTMTNNIVGPAGIGIEPQPRTATGEIHTEYAKALREAYTDWQRKPEVTHMHHWSRAQRLMARVWLRDGEAFAQMLTGPVPKLDHGTRVPLSLELFEPDMIPLDYNDGDRIQQGIERNAWGRPVAYYVFRHHPYETGMLPRTTDLKRIPTDNIVSIAAIDRIGQLRGASEFASIITRLEDIKDYEESERIAAKIAAALTAYVKRGQGQDYDPADVERNEDGTAKPRDLRLSPGTIIDNLQVGEEIGLISSDRPNPNVINFRQGQLRAIAAGVGASYSSIARDYNGTFSSQRQELVEQWVNYAVLTDEFVGQIIQPIWERFVAAAHLSGVVPRPRDVVENTASDALFVGQSMPWIDPLKEANAWLALVQAGFASEVEVMRKRGVNPRDVLEQIATYRAEVAKRGLTFSSDAATDKGTAPQEQESDEEKAAAKVVIDRVLASIDTGIKALAESDQKLRASQAAPNVTIHNAPPAVSYQAGDIHNHVPAAAAPEVHLEAILPQQPAPDVHVTNQIVTPEQPAPQVDVHVEAVMPDKTEVTIVGMPERTTTSTVERNGAGNIVKTTQTEKDA